MAEASREQNSLCAEADEVANELLFRTGKMLETGEAYWIRDCFYFPQTVETFVGKRMLFSDECVIEVFTSIRQLYERENVTDIARTVISAERLAPDLIGSVHVAKLLREDGQPYRAPYPVYSLIRKINRRWKITSTLYAILDSYDHNKCLSFSVPDQMNLTFSKMAFETKNRQEK